MPGCPLSDEYFVDPLGGLAGSTHHGGSGPGGGTSGTLNGGAAGSAASAAGPNNGGTANSAAGGNAATGADSGGTGKGGTGGSAAAGGADALGGGGSGGSTSGTAGDAGGDQAGAGGETTTCVPEPERCDGIDNDCNDAIDDGSVCPAGCTARYYDAHTYVLCITTKTRDQLGADDASSRCSDMGDEFGLTLDLGLAWIESSEENELLKTWILESAPATGALWTGANDKSSENHWVWGRRTEAEQFFEGSDAGGGKPYMDRFNDWGPDRPGNPNGDDEDCGAFDSEVDWQWNDRICSNPQLGFVCEEHPPALAAK